MKAWLHSIIAIAISSFCSALIANLTSPATFNLTADGLKHLLAVCGMSSALAVAALLVKSPLAPSDASGAGPDKALVWILLFGGFALPCSAQTASTGSSVTNLYAAGASFNQGATPAVAGSALYAHQLTISPDSYAGGTYAFTMLDILPNGTKPFTVSTNISAGIAQRVATIAGHDVLAPTSAGISFTGVNTGWAWSTGVAVPLRFKPKSDGSAWFLVPTVRVIKSSVGGGTGYQPVIGLMFGWGK
ncbi:hypothetical protein SAMN05421819_3552 [Bryocella elongata]|uniref:Uncharacterized protein n=1 Tax=Bryocella elongata TaxID=863522 RepID=A0A1H6B6P6_9BACT|nr:hypothetical protein [Bryocella elongata]SEG56204.1 hypothetical protein SAMN05421819_3552 [Bryocella elongata]